MKYDPNGQLLFSKTINGTVSAYTMEVDSSGNLYIAAAYVNEITVDNLHITTNLQGRKPILLKFNSNGELLWSKPIVQDFVDHFKSLTIDSNQNVYIGYDNYGDSYIEKLDANGNSLMLITQTNVKSISSIDIDTEGNIYGVGSCAEMNVSFNGTAVANSLLYNTYLVKYNTAGQFQWKHFVDDITCPEPQVKVRTPDEVYFSSYLFGAYSFGSIISDGPADGGFGDFFLAKLNNIGEYQWVKEVPGNGEVDLGNRNFLTLDNNGNAYLATKTKGTIQWGSGISTQSMGFNSDILVLKYNPLGQLQWVKMAGGSSEDRADGITVLPNGNVILTGMVYGNVTFDALTHNAASSTSYPYVTKINTENLGNHNPETAASMIVYPNPAKDAITLLTSGYRGNAQLYSALGQILKTIVIKTEETSIDISEFASGTYFLRLENLQIGKIIKL
ncbi:MAG: T9SS type A sorting domain-containing protein [Flavobacterium sp. JAD_PAG50586_2]|nr:MAG: T9SS type A sorting domain-containing protein [Flavobacterium sp. JAD_PAG50586_2]